jgi:hypothetical protein
MVVTWWNNNSEGRRVSVMPLPNPTEAHVTSDGERMVIAAKGVPEICSWRTALHTVTLGVRPPLSLLEMLNTHL